MWAVSIGTWTSCHSRLGRGLTRGIRTSRLADYYPGLATHRFLPPWTIDERETRSIKDDNEQENASTHHVC
jgi:hypothetical protein